jgi:hypothetical protein
MLPCYKMLALAFEEPNWKIGIAHHFLLNDSHEKSQVAI